MPVTPAEVSKLLQSMSNKSSQLDYIPTSLLKSCADIFSILISHLANLSFTQATFPSKFKLALISPLLKKPGLPKSELSKIFFYITMIRPVLEYASPVWHSSLTKKLRDKIESQQVRALRIIFGNFSYPQLLTLAELPPLHERREILGKKFFNNIIKPDNCLYHLIPPRRCSPVIIKLRVANVLPISKCRTERFKNSYIPYALSHYQI